MISAQQLHKIMPSATPARIANFIGPLNDTMNEFAITTPARQAAFLAQLAHESGSLRYVQEIASGAAYDNRADLGNTRPDAIALAELAGPLAARKGSPRHSGQCRRSAAGPCAGTGAGRR